MDNKKRLSLLLGATLTVTSIVSCKKDMNGSIPQNSQLSGTISAKGPIPSGNIRSWSTNLFAAQAVELATFELWGNQPGLMKGPVIRYTGGITTAATKTYGSSLNHEAFVYTDLDGVFRLVYNGTDHPMTLSGAPFVYSIEEIELHPTTHEVYAIVKSPFVNGPIDLYHISTTGVATRVGRLFSNPSSNGYKSGSITFVDNGAGYQLAFTSESTVYASSGMVVSLYNISGATMTNAGSYSFPASGIPGAQTGNLNTTSGDGKLYIARDGGNLYSFSLPLISSGTATLEANASNFTCKYDFGYRLEQ
ncbi:hypothetical protein [Chitinophaga varians]|uniref:hypothetical protein n=1 Tax=Chitinophaga varians TaxID=2202339 RepID=UPI00165EDBE4|nr:hypothetical protein [Chitinophaga varians]MBC9909696.1 hypothetical protein [Chitinophaga varians]